MTITVSKSELFQKLQASSKIISSKPTMPIMSCFLFEAKENALRITAADSSGRISLSINNATISDDISICYEAKLLLDALKTLPDQPLAFEINAETLVTVIRYHGGKFQITGKKSDVFPASKRYDDAKIMTVSSAQLLKGIEKVMFCAANDDLRPILTAILVENKDGKLNFVASDGYRLGLISYPSEATDDISFTLPQKMASVVKNIIPKNADITLKITYSNIEFEFEDTFISAQLLDGRFPNYRSVIPSSNDMKMTVSVADLKSALSRVMVFADSTQLIKLTLNPDTLTLTAQDINNALNSEEQLACESADSITIGLKGSYLYEIISAIDAETATLTFSDPNKAALIIPNDDRLSMTYLLMPMMLNE